MLPSSSGIAQYEWTQDSIVVVFTFNDAQDVALGIALEQEKGIIVDNYSFEGIPVFFCNTLIRMIVRFHKVRRMICLFYNMG